MPAVPRLGLIFLTALFSISVSGSLWATSASYFTKPIVEAALVLKSELREAARPGKLSERSWIHLGDKALALTSAATAAHAYAKATQARRAGAQS